MSADLATVTALLRRPYHRVLVPEPDGSWRGTIAELPGCIATGRSTAEASANLERVAESWLLATLAKGQPAPEVAAEREAATLRAELDRCRAALRPFAEVGRAVPISTACDWPATLRLMLRSGRLPIDAVHFLAAAAGLRDAPDLRDAHAETGDEG